MTHPACYQLWKALFLREFGRLRLRGTKFSFGSIGRAIIPLKGHQSTMARPPISSWKELYRVGRNWQTGRSNISVASEISPRSSISKPMVLLIGRSATIFSHGDMENTPAVTISASHGQQVTLASSKMASHARIRVSALALNQVVSSDASISIAIFYATSTKFHHLSTFNVSSDLKHSRETSITTPRVPRSPTRHSAYHSTLLIALSETFQLDIYYFPDSKSPDRGPTLLCSLSSFSSFLPTSLRISRPTISTTHKVLLSYAVPIYPTHWSVATTELLIDPSTTDVRTRTLRVFHSGWEPTEEQDELASPPSNGVLSSFNGMKMPAVTDVQTDGRYLVVVPSNENYMLLYRLRQASLAFVRVLFGPIAPVCAIAVADARCVSVSRDGTLWVHDLDSSWEVEVEEKVDVQEEMDVQVCFDDRRIVVTTPSKYWTISFD